MSQEPKPRMGRPPFPPGRVKVPFNLRILPEHRVAFDEAAAIGQDRHRVGARRTRDRSCEETAPMSGPILR